MKTWFFNLKYIKRKKFFTIFLNKKILFVIDMYGHLGKQRLLSFELGVYP